MRWIGAATCLTLITVVVSLAAAYLVNGSILKTVRVVDLRDYGGITMEDLRNLSLWRIAIAQLLHAKLPHMLFNALCLFLLGSLLEGAIGPLRLLLIWLIAGGVATLIGSMWVDAPWNVGTGASQAVFAFAGCAVVLALSDAIDRVWAFGLVALSVIPGTILDLVFANSLKPGHLAGFLLGVAFGTALLKDQPASR
jgi:membrane associated rhomboid family serine protease